MNPIRLNANSTNIITIIVNYKRFQSAGKIRYHVNCWVLLLDFILLLFVVDFENLFRGLGQGGGLGGVEVVMSMEEIPQALGGQGQNINTATTGASQPTDGSPQQHYGSQG